MELYGFLSQSAADQYNFLDLLFGPNDGSDSLQSKLRSITAKGGTFRFTLDLTNPTLRSLCRLRDGEEMHLDCQVSETQDPESFKKVFVLCQNDVTEMVMTQVKLQFEVNLRKSLQLERDKLGGMMQKQTDLIECLRWVGEVGRRAGTRARASQLIDAVKRQLTRVNEVVGGEAEEEDQALSTARTFHDLEINALLGQGGYGTVFKGKWRDLTVAVKRTILPSELKASDRRQVMALMELAITSTLLHPNIVKTHSYRIRPIREPVITTLSPLRRTMSSNHASTSIQSVPQPAPTSFEVQIIMEFCDYGTLRGSFEILTSSGGGNGGGSGNRNGNYKAILDTALDIALGMQHLHSCKIIHSDLKPANILLQSSHETPKGFVAKVADFGLSLCKDDATSSHVSGFRNGTSSHMAPEILRMDGKMSNASDVYSYGILLFEVYTGTEAYSDISLYSNFEYLVAAHNLRPTFPPDTPDGYKDLAVACWSQDRAARPSFEAIVSALRKLREAEEGETAPVDFSRLAVAHSATTGLASLFSIPFPSSGNNAFPETFQGPQHEPTPNDREFWEAMFGCNRP